MEDLFRNLHEQKIKKWFLSKQLEMDKGKTPYERKVLGELRKVFTGS